LFKQIEKIFFLIFNILTKYPVSNSYFGVRTTGFLMGINELMRSRDQIVSELFVTLRINASTLQPHTTVCLMEKRRNKLRLMTSRICLYIKNETEKEKSVSLRRQKRCKV